MKRKEITGGNPLVVLLALPIFFLVWRLLDLTFAIIAGVGSMALLLVLFVWIPDNQARKLSRKMRFAEIKKILTKVTLEVAKIKDSELKAELADKALVTFKGLVDDLFSAGKHQGLVEEKVLPSINNLDILVTKWINHETHRNPLSAKEETRLRATLMAMDNLYSKWQSGGVDSMDDLTAQNETSTDIQAAGIDVNEGDK